ncbi:MAG: PQQ-binding-like beta-propeller repeat protein [Candidatus Bathyarchaeota archaeon]|nr:PQQ-binding-like beta-propeller repeat protein [Candidatus Bathyarchaeota archaeon]
MNRLSVVLVLILSLAMATSSIFMSAVTAHTPPQNIPTFAYVTAAPNPVGVGQQVIIYMWLDKAPPTASGAYGDRWKDFTLTITKPDGTTETQKFTSDPVGFAWFMYTPTELGTYQLKFDFPGQTLEGENLDPFNFFGGTEYIGDYYMPSSSTTLFTVQQQQVLPYPSAEPPSGYWDRPVNPENREWHSFTGNWLATPMNHLAAYTEGPETAHILWTKPLTFGGLVGGEFGDASYHDGDAYEGKWFPPVIINGVLFYDKYPSNFNIPGYYAVDLRTGEEIYYNNDTRINFGQIYYYNTPNQHGAFAYLWTVIGGGFFGPPTTTWVCYDAFSGDKWYTITDAPPAPFSFVSTPQITYGADGSILIPQLDTVNHRLALWNSSAIPALLGGATGSNYWTWRPYNKVVDGKTGYSWNVSIPADVTGSISFVFPDKVIVSSGLGMGGTGFTFVETMNYTIWALSIKPGEQGKLLWKQTYTLPPGAPEGVTLNMGPASEEDGVFTIRSSQTMQWWGFSLNDGRYIWGPTEPQVAWDSLVGTQGYIAYGKLYTGGYGGILYCYDVQTGRLLWTYRLADQYYLEAKWGGNYNVANMLFADGKVYLFSGEHSPDDPKERGSLVRCVDAQTGQELWTFPFYDPSWATNPAIADGILVHFNAYDNRIYAFGKGQSATTVSAPQTVVPAGTAILITGTVTDQSAGAKGTPAIADEDMSEWMQYLYLQQPCPKDAKGVPVKLSAIDANGNTINIGTTTSDIYGNYAITWTPPSAGQFKIVAAFEGTKSYWSSFASTTLGVAEASATAEEPAAVFSMVDAVIILAVIIAILIGVVNLVFIKRIKK